VLAVTALVTAMAVLAGCGNSSSDSGGGDSSGSTSGPIKVMAMYKLTGTQGAYQPWANAVKAAAAEINADGGVNGREIDLVVCDIGISSNEELACGRQAVSEQVVGVVSYAQTAAFLPLLEQANIPIMDLQVSPEMATSPVSFGILTVPYSATAGLAALGKVENCKNLTMILSFPGTPAANKAYLEGFVEEGKSLGVGGDVVLAPAETVDFTSYVTRALQDGADCLGLEGLGPGEVGLVQAAATTAPADVKLFTNTGFLTPESIESMGAAGERLIITAPTEPETSTDNVTVGEWKKSIEKYSPDPKAFDSNSAASWAMMRALAYGISQVEGDLTSKALLDTLNGIDEYNPGFAPPVSFTEAPSGTPGPRIFATHSAAVKIKGGALYAADQDPWFNTFTGEVYKDEVQGPDTYAEESK
jgi:branched-chain amino acid transport system substrate-binding protein